MRRREEYSGIVIVFFFFGIEERGERGSLYSELWSLPADAQCYSIELREEERGEDTAGGREQ